MGRILETEPDVRPYLAAVIVATLQKANEGITVPMGMTVNQVP